ncbi:hypothetical protein CYY_000777 [Polysphondylium violaceum]|uniref:Tetratricopeptide-like helical domain-containing protein n=1 Tax=Polysphondylium violaceum TaxID=133409 RepID=A0A8J4Q2Z4_9MYCE|nr:hypothetical protein CYY_000777 [Polysphondylium violaceum]
MINRYLKVINKSKFNTIHNSNNTRLVATQIYKFPQNNKFSSITIINNNVSKTLNQSKLHYVKRDYSTSINSSTKTILNNDPLPKQYKQYIENALKEFQARDHSLAVEYLRSAIKSSPNLPNAYALMGDIYSFNRVNMGAIEYYEKAFAIKQTESVALSLGFLYSMGGEFEKAKQVYEKIIQINPNNDFAYYQLLKITGQRKFVDNLKEMNSGYYSIAKSMIATTDKEIMDKLGDFILEQDKLVASKPIVEAKKYTIGIDSSGYQRVLEADVHGTTPHLEALIVLGSMLMESNPQKALKVFSRCQDIHLFVELAYPQICFTLEEHGVSSEDLLQFLDRYIDAHPGKMVDPQLWLIRVDLLLHLNRLKEAIKVFSILIPYYILSEDQSLPFIIGRLSTADMAIRCYGEQLGQLLQQDTSDKHKQFFSPFRSYFSKENMDLFSLKDTGKEYNILLNQFTCIHEAYSQFAKDSKAQQIIDSDPLNADLHDALAGSILWCYQALSDLKIMKEKGYNKIPQLQPEMILGVVEVYFQNISQIIKGQ